MQKGDKSHYLDAFRDPGLPSQNTYDPKSETEKHIERLLRENALLTLTLSHPRRLGKDATPDDLAQDAKLSKLFLFGTSDLLKLYGIGRVKTAKQNEKYLTDPKVKSESAQIDFEEWIYTKIAYLRHELRFNATNGYKHEQELTAKKLVHRLENELNQQVQRYEKITKTKINLEKVPENHE